ncbi:UDP-N-acetylmuramate dehydrogenase [Legionella sp. km535]|uniref:UDP-N-acetylmuramate dehydrogenase n=1 Tax=Legionella sp. km535 TaxID=2498107 RepID=UPI000F8EB5CD|nr:UDP-N-acetylmuramate dehydrogenase [Legionella sp. km535]RUR15829.1 UDP-N-acetylmuramate dehydrogenase [Legionella sp. km535]
MIKQPFDLKAYNTFGFSVKSMAGAVISSANQLVEAIELAQLNQLPIIIIGGGSNIVLKNNLPGLVLIIKIQGIDIIEEHAEYVYIRVGAGVVWDELVQYSLNQGWYGLENLSIIPGTVGACPIQNVGAYGVEIKDFFYELTALDINTLQEKVLTNNDCCFQYRDSIFKNEYKDKYVITSVTFKLSKNPQINLTDLNLRKELEHLPYDEISPESVRSAVITIRNRRLPKVDDIGNAGSFFMNPIVEENVFNNIFSQYKDLLFTPLEQKRFKISAGWLIDKCGWKGHQDNEVGVYEKNPLVLINHGGGTGDQLLALSEKIEHSVFTTFGIKLKMEPRLYY